MDKSIWSWDSVYKCRDCEESFYVTSIDGYNVNFCPFCASRDIDDIDEDFEQ